MYYKMLFIEKIKLILSINFLFFFYFIYSCSLSNAQTKAEMLEIKKLFENQKNLTVYEFTKHNTNEIQLMFSCLFLFYKKYISSQDAMSCNFTPSCSEYGLEAVKKQGALIGILNTLDRLSRCNGLSQHNYSKHPATNLFHDPVE